VFASLASLAVRLAAIRWAIKSLIGLGVLVPVAFVLKLVGLPILAVLGILAFPVLLVLFVLGLPIFLVLIVGGMLLGGLFFIMSIGLLAIKFLVFVVLPIWLAWIAVSFLWRLARPRPTPAATEGSGAI
jgi:hypothetical protein